MSSPVAGSWATCPLRNSSPPPRTPSENGAIEGGSLSLVMASRVMINKSFLSRRKCSADDAEALFQPVQRLVAEAEPEDVAGVAEPGTAGDEGPLPPKVGVEAVDVLGPESSGVKLHAAHRPGLGRQPVQLPGVPLDPPFDDLTSLGQERAALGEDLVSRGQQPDGEQLVECPARQRGVELG